MQMAIAELTRWGRRRGRGAGEIGALTEPIVGVEAAREAADGVEHVEAERPAELRRQAQQEAGDAAEVGPHRRGRRRRRPHHEAAPEHRGQRRELLRRRRRAPYAGAPRAGARGRPATAVLVVPRHGRRGHRGGAGREPARLFWLAFALPAWCLLCLRVWPLSRRDAAAQRLEVGWLFLVVFTAIFCVFFSPSLEAARGTGGACAPTSGSRQWSEWDACLTAHHIPTREQLPESPLGGAAHRALFLKKNVRE